MAEPKKRKRVTKKSGKKKPKITQKSNPKKAPVRSKSSKAKAALEAELRRYTVMAVDELTLDDVNPRDHVDESVGHLADSLDRFQQQKNIVVDGNNKVIAGNGLVMAARKDGRKWIIANRTSLTGAEARAFAIADNRLAELSTWNVPNLVEIVAEHDLDLTGIGFTPDDIAGMSETFEPDQKQPPRLDQKSPITCPKCGHEFTI